MSRLLVDPESATVPCGQCGREAVHVGRLVQEDGTPVSHAVVCTVCRAHRPGPGLGETGVPRLAVLSRPAGG
ncbi:hypothetical protein [Amycolatopsis sp. NPDC054798]